MAGRGGNHTTVMNFSRQGGQGTPIKFQRRIEVPRRASHLSRFPALNSLSVWSKYQYTMETIFAFFGEGWLPARLRTTLQRPTVPLDTSISGWSNPGNKLTHLDIAHADPSGGPTNGIDQDIATNPSDLPIGQPMRGICIVYYVGK